MTKEYTQILKGFAIIMMVWCHLFGKATDIGAYYDFTINKLPISFLLTRVCTPVPMFLFLGGYGLYCVYTKGRDKHHISRIIKLYLHYWVILAIFVPVGIFYGGGNYFTSLTRVLENLTGVVVNWNYECWFLFPYALLSLSYPLIFKLIDRFKPWPIITITFIASLCSISFYHFGLNKDAGAILNIIVTIINFLFCFCCGALTKKYKVIERFRKYIDKLKSINLYLAIALLMLLRIIVPHASWSGVYSIVIIILLSSLSYNKYPRKVLTFLGNHSMNIWMIHTWFCYYIFHSFIYSFKYPLVIFIVTLILSLLFSFIVNYICKIKEVFKVIRL